MGFLSTSLYICYDDIEYFYFKYLWNIDKNFLYFVIKKILLIFKEYK